jgi:putative flippase GtrA
METMAHGARYAAAMTAITRRLPFGLSRVIEPNMLGYLVINLCTFCIDLGLLGLLHGKERLPIPVAVTISYGTASLISYALNRVFNFRSHAEVGRQLPVFVAVSASNYLIFVLGLTDLLSTVGVYYELARVLAACCEAVYLYCMMRWIVFRDVADPDDPDAPETAAGVTAAGATLAQEHEAGTGARATAETTAETPAGSATAPAAGPVASTTGTERQSEPESVDPAPGPVDPAPTEPVYGPAVRPN